MAKQEHILSGNANIVGEADDRNTGRTGNRRCLKHIVAAKWAEDEFVSIRNRAACSRIDAKRGVVGNYSDVGNLGISHRQSSCIGNRLAHIGVGTGNGQQQSDAVKRIDRIGRNHWCRALAATRYCRARGEHRQHRERRQLPQPARYGLRVRAAY